MGEKVSIVIPVYNTKEYLTKCLDSVVHQTYRNIEIIIVDDGSTDGSGKICDKYAGRDERIQVIHQENRGIAGAYTTAFHYINGSYILFVDSDDYIEKDMVEGMLSLLKQHNADISQCCCVYHNENEKVSDSNRNPDRIKRFQSNEEIMAGFLDDGNEYFQRNAGLKLYKRELFENVSLKYGMQFVDIILLLGALEKCNRYVWTSKQYYHVNVRQDSMSRGNNSIRHIKDSRQYARLLETEISEHYPQFYDYMDYYYVKFSMLHYNEVYADKTVIAKAKLLAHCRKDFLRHYPACKQSKFFKNAKFCFKLEASLFRKQPLLTCRIRQSVVIPVRKKFCKLIISARKGLK